MLDLQRYPIEILHLIMYEVNIQVYHLKNDWKLFLIVVSHQVNCESGIAIFADNNCNIFFLIAKINIKLMQ